MLNASAVKINDRNLGMPVVVECRPAHVQGAACVDPIQCAVQIEVFHQGDILELCCGAIIDVEYAIVLPIQDDIITADIPIPNQRAASIIISAYLGTILRLLSTRRKLGVE